MNEYFVSRELCSCCGYAKNDEIYHGSYIEKPLRDYLISFYSPQGGVEFEYLTNQDYILTECQRCGLIYQKEIPNEFLMHKLYEEWIDPNKVLELCERATYRLFLSSLY